MKRLIVDYKKLTDDILDLLIEKYPQGYRNRDIITFKNQRNETIEAIEVRSEDTIYLVKVSTKLADTMQEYEDAIGEGEDFDFYKDDGALDF